MKVKPKLPNTLRYMMFGDEDRSLIRVRGYAKKSSFSFNLLSLASGVMDFNEN